MERFPWLSYSEYKSGAYCRVCVVMGRSLDEGKGGHQRIGQLVTEPFCKWKNALEIFEAHAKSGYHKRNSELADNFLKDCAEQTVFSFAANMLTTMYMRFINQRNRTQEKQSFYHMNIGYQRTLSFMKPDGSFSLFRSDWNQSASSVWLTSFVAQMLQEASFYEWENFIYIDPEVISKAVSWVLRHQSWDGAFYEVTWSPDRKMNDSLHWPRDEVRYRNISLTAHVLIMLETVKDLTGGLGAQVATAQNKAIKWLERNLKLLDDRGEPFEVAIVAYALLLSKASTAELAFGILAKHARREGGLTYWAKESVPPPPYKMENQKPFSLPRLPYKYDSTNIQATSYALLTYVARQELMIDPIVKWLNSQRLTDGGWASTQCPYCPIYNLATALPVPVTVILATCLVAIVRHFRSAYL
ncbi:hypothetical protein C0J52_24875 [Blattella germanica]|nr:hypothetical protein C0J52_24875 [Blattella germanica]